MGVLRSSSVWVLGVGALARFGGIITANSRILVVVGLISSCGFDWVGLKKPTAIPEAGLAALGLFDAIFADTNN